MYDKSPCVLVASSADACHIGWTAIASELRSRAGSNCVVCIECYPGVFEDELCEQLTQLLEPACVILTKDLFLSPEALSNRVAPLLTDDPVFGIMSKTKIKDFFNEAKLLEARESVNEPHAGLALVIGTGAVEVAPKHDLLVYADLARWEIQKRQRQGLIGNLAADNLSDSAAAKYKRAFFLDWRAADKLKQTLFSKIDYLLDTNESKLPKLIAGDVFRTGLKVAVERPFRVVPFFDPGPWGGHWMENVCDLPRDVPNYAWCFDCVPEENSLVLGFGDARIEIPAVNLVLHHPRELLGDQVYRRFGAEFPIRFDLLDTIDGGNLSLQVHPLTAYVQEKFGIAYTQDESYYMLDAQPGAKVYLGLKEGMKPADMLRDLNLAQGSTQDQTQAFDADKYVDSWPAYKHDHFLIPAGTVHCSGKGSMVLEISATPYIFTFKLWDWGRLGMDGKPRPIHLNRGAENIQWDRTTEWVESSLVNRIEQLGSGEGWREERTGLHELEFIETRRHWFTGKVQHHTHGTVNVLNLVKGDEAIVESPDNSFMPFVIHYAETFIVPAQVGAYSIRPHGPAVGSECATLKAYVRSSA